MLRFRSRSALAPAALAVKGPRQGAERIVAGVAPSPREFECLEGAARGKSRRDIGRILGISQRTAGFRPESAKAKRGVRTTYHQAVALLAASGPTLHRPLCNCTG